VNAIAPRQLWLLFAAAFAARLILFLLFQPWTDAVVVDSVIVDDAAQYHRLAVCIVTELSFCGDTFRTPGYPLFIALFYSLFGEAPWVVLISQAFVDLATMYVVFKIGQLVFTERVGLIGAALFAFDTNTMFATTTLLTETLFVCVLMGGFYFYLRALLRFELASAILGGLLLALATLIRPVAEYLFVILIVFAVAWITTGTIKARLKTAAILSLAFALTIAPWAYRNYALYDTVSLSSIQGENLLFWQVTYAKTWETGRAPEDIEAEFRAEAASRGYEDGGNPFENAAIAQEIAVEYISSHPMTYASRLMTGILHTFTNLGTGGIVNTLGYTPTYLPPEVMFSSDSEFALVSRFFATKTPLEIVVGMLVLAMLMVHYSAFALGAMTLLASRRFAILLLFGAAIAYFAVTSGPIGLARFRLPVTPLYLLVGSVFIDQLLERIRARGTTQSRVHA
jgi:4-amino-4-deoxy-L-arabinose transferase-like glycosyltransferase